MNVQIRYHDGALTISLSGQPGSPSGGNGGDSPFGGNPDGGVICGGTTVIGPIVLPMGGPSQVTGGNGGDSPFGGNGGDSPFGGNGGDSPFGGTGGGNPSSCSGPIIIGPIVFTDCGAPTTTPVAASLQAVNISPFIARAPRASNDPPATTPFTVEPQQEAQWCWAAVAVSVHNYLTKSSTLEQPALVAKLLDTVCDGTPNPLDPCNQAFTLDGPLRNLGDLVEPDGGQFDRIVKFADLQTYWDKAPFPICARIVWDDGSDSAHFIALTASLELTNGQQLVSVHDPSPSAFGPAQWDYDALRLHYQGPPNPGKPGAHMPKGHWNDTYFVTS